jgi:CRP-like cAMP-binding protein
MRAGTEDRTMENLERYLREHDFFADMKDEYIELLVGCASNVRFEEGEALFREGEDANSFFLIREGRIALELSAPGIETVTLQTCGEDEVVGWSWLIGPNRWRYTGRATCLTRALEMEGSCIRAKCDKNHEFGYELLERFSKVLAHRLESTRLQLLDVYAADGGVNR